jgi:uncharacterized protein related to proFAR isomerase
MGLTVGESTRVHCALQDLNSLSQSGAHSSLISTGESLEFLLSDADWEDANFVALKTLIYEGYKQKTEVLSNETQRRRQEQILHGVDFEECDLGTSVKQEAVTEPIKIVSPPRSSIAVAR